MQQMTRHAQTVKRKSGVSTEKTDIHVCMAPSAQLQGKPMPDLELKPQPGPKRHPPSCFCMGHTQQKNSPVLQAINHAHQNLDSEQAQQYHTTKEAGGMI